MVSKKINPSSIEENIEAAPAETQDKLLQFHEAIRSCTPGAVEGLKWRMPAYSYQKILVTWAVFRYHIGFYPMPSAIKAFAKDLKNYKTNEGSVQFPLDQKLPVPLIKKIVKFRVKESKDGTIKWKS